MTDFIVGVKNGEHKVWNKDGILIVHEWYKDGKRFVFSKLALYIFVNYNSLIAIYREGICVRWWEETGKVMGRYSFKGGVLDGESTEYYRNGEK